MRASEGRQGPSDKKGCPRESIERYLVLGAGAGGQALSACSWAKSRTG